MVTGLTILNGAFFSLTVLSSFNEREKILFDAASVLLWR